MDFDEAWRFLDNLQFFTIKLGLDSMNLFLERLGSPQKKIRYVHVAGSNGKGSVSATLQSVLSCAGYRVGFYSSPHLSSVRERFRINHSFIDEASFARLSRKIIDVLQDDQITYFEFTTTLAFLWFAEQNVDLAVMEVGMGGRLDATNVITPLVSVITNISLDHQEYLGDTIDSIAREKAGIIKPEIPVVCGNLVVEAKAVVEEICECNHVPLYRFRQEFSCTPDGPITLRYDGISTSISGITLKLFGHFQYENTAIALAALEVLGQKGFAVSDETIRHGVGQVSWPGRLEFMEIQDDIGQPRQFLLDGAHNTAGILALIDTLQHQFSFKKLIVVWASMADKDFAGCLAMMVPLADCLIFTRPDKNRSATVEQLQACLVEEQTKIVLACENVNDAVKMAMKQASPDDLICIAGSLYLVGYARLFLCGEIVNG